MKMEEKYKTYMDTSIMQKNNYEVIERYGNLSVRASSKNRNIRIERQFGSDYSIERINERIIE